MPGIRDLAPIVENDELDGTSAVNDENVLFVSMDEEYNLNSDSDSEKPVATKRKPVVRRKKKAEADTITIDTTRVDKKPTSSTVVMSAMRIRKWRSRPSVNSFILRNDPRDDSFVESDDDEEEEEVVVDDDYSAKKEMERLQSDIYFAEDYSLIIEDSNSVRYDHKNKKFCEYKPRKDRVKSPVPTPNRASSSGNAANIMDLLRKSVLKKRTKSHHSRVSTADTLRRHSGAPLNVFSQDRIDQSGNETQNSKSRNSTAVDNSIQRKSSSINRRANKRRSVEDSAIPFNLSFSPEKSAETIHTSCEEISQENLATPEKRKSLENTSSIAIPTRKSKTRSTFHRTNTNINDELKEQENEDNKKQEENITEKEDKVKGGQLVNKEIDEVNPLLLTPIRHDHSDIEDDIAYPNDINDVIPQHFSTPLHLNDVVPIGQSTPVSHHKGNHDHEGSPIIELSSSHTRRRSEKMPDISDLKNDDDEKKEITPKVITANLTTNDLSEFDDQMTVGATSMAESHYMTTNNNTINTNSMLGEPIRRGRNASQLILDDEYNPPWYLIDYDGSPHDNMKKFLHIIGQKSIISWNDLPQDMLKKPTKLGEGSYGEVYSTLYNGEEVAIKVIPFVEKYEASEFRVNGEVLMDAHDQMIEPLTTKELSQLDNLNEDYSTPNFIHLVNTSIVRGCYPKSLLKAWDAYKKKYKGTEKSQNERPSNYARKNQLFLIMTMRKGGKEMEDYKCKNEKQLISIMVQLILSLHVAEKCLQFEHRDLHVGNLLVEESMEDLVYKVGGNEFTLKSAGCHIKIIDFTNSRIHKNGASICKDLAKDEEMFENKQTDYQFDVYRNMKKANGNVWNKFNKKTNAMWVHYMSRKLLETNCVEKISEERTKELQDIFDEVIKLNSLDDVLLTEDGKLYALINDYIAQFQK